jgi:hypothetical protein
MRTIILYDEGDYDEEYAMKRLRYLKANDQVSFHTSRAMDLLELIGKEHV